MKKYKTKRTATKTKLSSAAIASPIDAATTL